jgi:hypothetical protein
VIRRAPYWIALYGPHGTGRRIFSDRPLTPDGLTKQYDVWGSWDLWQYGGVVWQGGRSNPKHYNTGRWRSPKYFGNMAHPLERNVFKGSEAQLRGWWERHGWAWWE